MKTTFKFLALFFITTITLAQTSIQSDEQKIRELIKDSFQEILSDNKKEKLPEFFTEDFLLLEDGEVWDLEIIKGYMDKAAEMDPMPERINSFDFIEIKISGDMAWTAYHNTAVFKMGEKVVGEMNWLESASAIRTEEGWRLQLLHSTVIETEQE